MLFSTQEAFGTLTDFQGSATHNRISITNDQRLRVSFRLRNNGDTLTGATFTTEIVIMPRGNRRNVDTCHGAYPRIMSEYHASHRDRRAYRVIRGQAFPGKNKTVNVTVSIPDRFKSTTTAQTLDCYIFVAVFDAKGNRIAGTPGFACVADSRMGTLAKKAVTPRTVKPFIENRTYSRW